jgi:hypothetical protein
VVLEIRTSERACFKRCPQRWEWAYKECLKPLRIKNPLWFGQAVHVALAEWYQQGKRRGPHPAETFSQALEGERRIIVRPGVDDDEIEYVDARNLGRRMLFNYVEEFGRDEQMNIVSTEQSAQVMVRPLRSGGTPIRYCMTFDGVYRDEATGLFWLLEHKTAAGINVSHLPLDQQASSYWAMVEHVLKKAGLWKRGDRIEGIMYNFLRKADRDPRPVNAQGLSLNKATKKEHYWAALDQHNIRYHGAMSMPKLQELARAHGITVGGEVSKSQPAALFLREPVSRTPEERNHQIKNIQMDGWHIDQARNNPGYPIVKNPTKDCSWDCDFFTMCQVHEQGDSETTESFKRNMYRKWDPYKDHNDERKSA